VTDPFGFIWSLSTPIKQEQRTQQAAPATA
jgi:hypothetical protein